MQPTFAIQARHQFFDAHKNSTSQSLSLIAKGTVSNPPTTFIIKPYLNSPHNIV